VALVDIIMPQMGESIAEGTLSKWLKKVGDEIKRDEPIFEISTDKVDAEIPAASAGTLAEILVKEGETVAVQTVVGRLETEKGATIVAAGVAGETAKSAGVASAAPTPTLAPPKGEFTPGPSAGARPSVPPASQQPHQATETPSKTEFALARHHWFEELPPSTASMSPRSRGRVSPGG